jgi:hypothetical protein
MACSWCVSWIWFGFLIGARGKNTQLPLADLVRRSVCTGRAMRMSTTPSAPPKDPAFRLIGFEKVLERGAALTSREQSFETELLTQAKNLIALAALNRGLVAKGGSHLFTAAGSAGDGQYRNPCL